jgi:ribonuclease P protein component
MSLCVLNKRGQFLRVQSSGRRYKGRFGVLFALSSSDSLLESRVGLTVSKRVGNAVVRNTVKRRAREIFRALLVDVPQGGEYVWIAYQEASQVPYSDLKEDVQCLMARSLR